MLVNTCIWDHKIEDATCTMSITTEHVKMLNLCNIWLYHHDFYEVNLSYLGMVNYKINLGLLYKK